MDYFLPMSYNIGKIIKASMMILLLMEWEYSSFVHFLGVAKI